MIGQLSTALEESGIADNTIVVFTSDHGDNLGSHHLFNKDVLFDESIRVPMIFSWLGKLAPQDNTGQVAQLVDVMPTVLGLCGLEIPTHVQGRDLSTVLLGRAAALNENYGFIETPPTCSNPDMAVPEIGIRTPIHMYGISLADNLREIANDGLYFYDLRDDPYQERNLAGKGEQEEMAAGLREKALSWNDATPWLRPPG